MKVRTQTLAFILAGTLFIVGNAFSQAREPSKVSTEKDSSKEMEIAEFAFKIPHGFKVAGVSKRDGIAYRLLTRRKGSDRRLVGLIAVGSTDRKEASANARGLAQDAKHFEKAVVPSISAAAGLKVVSRTPAKLLGIEYLNCMESRLVCKNSDFPRARTVVREIINGDAVIYLLIAAPADSSDEIETPKYLSMHFHTPASTLTRVASGADSPSK